MTGTVQLDTELGDVHLITNRISGRNTRNEVFGNRG